MCRHLYFHLFSVSVGERGRRHTGAYMCTDTQVDSQLDQWGLAGTTNNPAMYSLSVTVV